MFKLISSGSDIVCYTYEFAGVTYYLDISSSEVICHYNGGVLFTYKFQILGVLEDRVYYSKTRLLGSLGV